MHKYKYTVLAMIANVFKVDIIRLLHQYFPSIVMTTMLSCKIFIEILCAYLYSNTNTIRLKTK